MRKMAAGDDLLSERLRQQTPNDDERERKRDYQGRTSTCTKCTVYS